MQIRQIQKLNANTANFPKNLQVKITFKHLSFARKAHLTCRNPPPPLPRPGIRGLNFSFVWFILDYKYQKNLI